MLLPLPRHSMYIYICVILSGTLFPISPVYLRSYIAEMSEKPDDHRDKKITNRDYQYKYDDDDLVSVQYHSSIKFNWN